MPFCDVIAAHPLKGLGINSEAGEVPGLPASILRTGDLQPHPTAMCALAPVQEAAAAQARKRMGLRVSPTEQRLWAHGVELGK